MAKRPSALLDTRIIYCGDCLDQLRKLPDGWVVGQFEDSGNVGVRVILPVDTMGEPAGNGGLDSQQEYGPSIRNSGNGGLREYTQVMSARYLKVVPPKRVTTGMLFATVA